MVNPKKDCFKRLKEENAGTNNNKGNNTNKCGYCKMNNHEEKACYKNNPPEKEFLKFTDEVMFDKIFIEKRSSNKYDSNKFISDSKDTSHIVTT